MDEAKKRKISGRTIRKIAITLLCIMISICIAYVMFGVYDPAKNSLRALSSVSMDIICIIILVVLLGSFALDSYGLKRTTQLFVGLLVATEWAVFLDFLNWAFDGSLEFGHLTYWFTVGSLCMGAILAGLFSLYLYSYMEETHGLSRMRKSATICALINLISFCLTFILAITGTAFRFVDGHYETGVLYDVVTVIPVLTLLYLTGFTIFCVKKVGLHDVYAVAGYIAFMIAGALIEATYSIGTTYVAVTIADIFILVMLQNEILAREKQSVEEWMRKSNTDGLTGFYNRYAYEADLKNLEQSELSLDFVYISVDVNSLKMVNDSLGHTAGDEMIVGAAACLEKCFGPYGKLYRTGGDEFIALIYADSDQLQRIRKDIEESTNAWSGKMVQKLTISCGYVTHREDENLSVRQMAILADRRMYEAKRAYYQNSGIERRKR